MKTYSILFMWWLSLTVVQAQRVFPVMEEPTFSANDSTIGFSYVELNEPYVVEQPSQAATVLIHVLDPKKRPYSGYLFRVEYKDFKTGVWHTYRYYQTIVAQNDGQERVMPLIHQLPNGYYRVWAQCLRTGSIGTEPLVVNAKQELPEPIQFTLPIPQNQDWLPK